MGRRRNIKLDDEAVRLAFRRERERLGLTQVGLSLQLGYYKTFMNKIENGERSLGLSEFHRICGALGLDPEAFHPR